MSNPTVEWAPFHLQPGVEEEALITASQRLQSEFLANQDGFLKRELVRGQGGEYVDIVWWASKEAAEAIMAKVPESAACAAYFSLMGADAADPGAGVRHFTSLRTY